jgi:UDP-N-acetylmuramoylalanine--D-glutamate ligase
MRAADLKDKNIVIWGTGREGKAAAAFLRKTLPNAPFIFVDEAQGSDAIEGLGCECAVIRGDDISAALDAADVLIKSPGVSLYHPLVQKLKARGVPVTSLLNLWLADPRTATVIGITGTKGKSTTAALLAHALTALGKKAIAVGNIGVPVTESSDENADFIVVEVSSYQAANIDEKCPVGLLTSLYPEHLDWHKSLDVYYKDKLNLIAHCPTKIVNHEALETLKQHNLSLNEALFFNQPSGIHTKNGCFYDNGQTIGLIKNAYLSRAHNLSNVCAVLAALKHLGLDMKAALRGMEDFRGLPHRQQELGKKDSILYVDDSIATTPQSAIAAMEAYPGRALTLIAGGQDRGIDYTPLVDYVLQKKIHAVICMGPSGERIFNTLKLSRSENISMCGSMKEAVTLAKTHTPQGGVILLSPAAPSYGLFKDFVERGKCFAEAAGFEPAQK